MLDTEKTKSIIESLVFTSDTPLSVDKIKELLGEEDLDNKAIKAYLQQIQEECLSTKRGIKLEEIAGGYQFRSKIENAFWIQRLYTGRTSRLSQAALEVLAVIAYRQPITRIEIEEIRGVDCGGVLKTLLEKSLVRISGKKDEPGRPLLYATTKEFLAHFSLNSLADLPSLKEIESLDEVSQHEDEESSSLSLDTASADQEPQEVDMAEEFETLKEDLEQGV